MDGRRCAETTCPFFLLVSFFLVYHHSSRMENSWPREIPAADRRDALRSLDLGERLLYAERTPEPPQTLRFIEKPHETETIQRQNTTVQDSESALILSMSRTKRSSSRSDSNQRSPRR